MNAQAGGRDGQKQDGIGRLKGRTDLKKDRFCGGRCISETALRA